MVEHGWTDVCVLRCAAPAAVIIAPSPRACAPLTLIASLPLPLSSTLAPPTLFCSCSNSNNAAPQAAEAVAPARAQSPEKAAAGVLPMQQGGAQPGKEAEMVDRPVFITDAYKGSGKLRGKVALITGARARGGRGLRLRAWRVQTLLGGGEQTARCVL